MRVASKNLISDPVFETQEESLIQFRRRKQLRVQNLDKFVILIKTKKHIRTYVVVLPISTEFFTVGETKNFEVLVGYLYDTAATQTKALELAWEAIMLQSGL